MATNSEFLLDVSPRGPTSAQREPSADIVFVHGLNPRSKPEFARATWTHANGDFWPTQQLGQLVPGSRILLFSYNSQAAWGASTAGIKQHANNLLVRLADDRSSAGREHCPIVFVAHSLGGLVVKQALVIAKNDDNFKAIREATTSLVFFAVPHRGGRHAKLGAIAKNIVTALKGEGRNDLVDSLCANSLFQEEQAEYFRQQLEYYHIFSVVETLPTVLSKKLWSITSTIIVDGHSATLGLPGPRELVLTLNANHSDVCRFANGDPQFTPVLNKIKKLVEIPLLQQQQQQQQQQSAEQGCEPIQSIPLPRNAQFVGRDDQLNDLRKRLFGASTCPRVALHGLGGMGKTQIAVQLAYQARDAFPRCSIFWIPAVSVESVRQAYAEIARLLRIEVPAGEETATAKYVNEYLSRQSAGQWLLIVDNVDVLEILLGSSTQSSVMAIFPYSKYGAILYTTRTREVATALAGSEVITVEEMLPEAASRLLSTSLIAKPCTDAEQKAASELLKDLTYLPLAITQAVAYINSTGEPISGYLRLLRSTEDNLVETLSQDFADLNRYLGSRNPVVATWLVSFQRIQQEEPLAAKLLSFLSCIQPTAIPESILPADQPAVKMTCAVGKLSAYSFITRRVAEREYEMHRLVHLAARNWVRSEKRTGATQMKTMERFDEVYPNPRFENREMRGRLAPHLQKLLSDYEAEKSREWWRSSMKMAWTLHTEGRIKEALQQHMEAERWTAITLPEDDPDRLKSQQALALAYQADGQTSRAVAMLEHVVEVEETLIEDNPRRLILQQALAQAYEANDQMDKAIEILKYIIRVGKTWAEDDPSRLTLQYQLGRAYLANGEVSEALELLTYVVEARKALVENHPDRLASQHELARAYLANGQVDKTIEMMSQVVEFRKTLAEDHPDRLISEHVLARAYDANGQADKAIEMLEHVLKMVKALAKDHPNLLASRHTLAVAYLTNGKVDKAIEILEYVVEVEKALVENHPRRLASQHALATAYLVNGQVDKAIEMLEHVVEIKKALAEHRSSRLASQHELARAYLADGQVDRAIEMLEHVVNVQKALTENRPGILVSQRELARAYKANGRVNEAIEILEHVVEAEKTMAENHPDRLSSQQLLGDAYLSNGQASKAVETLEHVVEVRKALAEDDPRRQASQHLLAAAYRAKCQVGKDT